MAPRGHTCNASREAAKRPTGVCVSDSLARKNLMRNARATWRTVRRFLSGAWLLTLVTVPSLALTALFVEALRMHLHVALAAFLGTVGGTLVLGGALYWLMPHIERWADEEQ
jgi:hypothetical protein